MSISKGVLRVYEDSVAFYCPGCKFLHYIPTAPDTWAFNNDYDKPTFSPSIKVEGVEPLTDAECEKVLQGVLIPPRSFTCHSYVREGIVQFLSDCSHSLVGTTVNLEPVTSQITYR